MVPLSARTREHLTLLFRSGDLPDAEQLLGGLDDDSSAAARTPESLERLRFAALRLSGGTLAGLRAALSLAGVDWRDLLMAADFGVDVDAHASWQPRVFNDGIRSAWRRGEVYPEVAFAPNQRVRVGEGRYKEQMGSVIDLLALEPRPRYRVRTDGGRETDAWEAWLRAAG